MINIWRVKAILVDRGSAWLGLAWLLTAAGWMAMELNYFNWMLRYFGKVMVFTHASPTSSSNKNETYSGRIGLYFNHSPLFVTVEFRLLLLRFFFVTLGSVVFISEGRRINDASRRLFLRREALASPASPERFSCCRDVFGGCRSPASLRQQCDA